ncbi:hypothetical protein OH805_08830 [Streptomyces sp. NBC_00879]|uniref:hypothetical protein n=1 Tax=Streptomyces sp. NBC_00879 TaxID=2975855 RepID=UPI003868F584|nr:hypothetical protein OH805_08830 [Streptomyces sp. NBC_00879]
MKFQITDKGQYSLQVGDDGQFFLPDDGDYTRFPYAECAVCWPEECPHVEPFPICLGCMETWIQGDEYTVVPGFGRGRRDRPPLWPDLYGIQEVTPKAG